MYSSHSLAFYLGMGSKGSIIIFRVLFMRAPGVGNLEFMVDFASELYDFFLLVVFVFCSIFIMCLKKN